VLAVEVADGEPERLADPQPGTDQQLEQAAVLLAVLLAPWLLLAFLAGWTQREPRRAALLGLACTLSAIAGYGLMTLSPLENAELTPQSAARFVLSQTPVIVGGLLTGRLFGWLGSRWRNERASLGALVVAGAFCLEPLARASIGDAIAVRTVWMTEVGVGLAVAVLVTSDSLAAQGTRPPRRG